MFDDMTTEEEIEQDLIEQGFRGEELAEAVEEVLGLMEKDALLEGIEGEVGEAIERGCYFISSIDTFLQ
jgi:hypothetical protein